MHQNMHYSRASSNVPSGSLTSSPVARPTTSQNYQTRNLRARATPSTSQYRKAHSVSPSTCFASSQFQSSPSARSIPLPPTKWISPLQNEPVHRPPSSSSSISSSDSDSGMSTSSSYDRPDENICGVRVCPLQLIAAVASS